MSNIAQLLCQTIDIHASLNYNGIVNYWEKYGQKLKTAIV